MNDKKTQVTLTESELSDLIRAITQRIEAGADFMFIDHLLKIRQKLVDQWNLDFSHYNDYLINPKAAQSGSAPLTSGQGVEEEKNERRTD